MSGASLIVFLAVWTGLSATLGWVTLSYLRRSLEIGRTGNFAKRWIERDEHPAQFEAAIAFYGFICAMAFVFSAIGLILIIREIGKTL